MSLIQVFGPGCVKCRQAEDIIHKVVKETGSDAVVEKVTDMQAILSLGILSTPAVTVDGKIKLTGRVPSREEIIQWLGK